MTKAPTTLEGDADKAGYTGGGKGHMGNLCSFCSICREPKTVLKNRKNRIKNNTCQHLPKYSRKRGTYVPPWTYRNFLSSKINSISQLNRSLEDPPYPPHQLPNPFTYK